MAGLSHTPRLNPSEAAAAVAAAAFFGCRLPPAATHKSNNHVILEGKFSPIN